MRTQYFGDLKLTNEGGTPIDVKYAELAERYPELFDAELSAPLDQLERIGEVARSIRKTGVELDAYYGDDAADFKAYARNGFDDAVEQLTRDVKGVQRYEADQAAQRQAREQKTSVPAPVSTDALKAAYETASLTLCSVSRSMYCFVMPQSRPIRSRLLISTTSTFPARTASITSCRAGRSRVIPEPCSAAAPTMVYPACSA